MKQHKDSHLDHGLTPAVVDYIMTRFAERDAFFIETFELPAELDAVPCALYGPVMGDPGMNRSPPAFYMRRGDRAYESHVVRAPMRPTRTVTVIAGPHDGLPCVLFTAFGGPVTPKEPMDPTLAPEKAGESAEFWSVHALAVV